MASGEALRLATQAYWTAETFVEQRGAYFAMLRAGALPSYGESSGEVVRLLAEDALRRRGLMVRQLSESLFADYEFPSNPPPVSRHAPFPARALSDRGWDVSALVE